MPEWLALCELGAPGWGEPWFLHGAVLLFLAALLYGDVFSVVDLLLIVSRHTNPFDDAQAIVTQLNCAAQAQFSPCQWSLVFLFAFVCFVDLFVLFCCCFCFAFVVCVVCCFYYFGIVMASQDCVLVLFQHGLFLAHLFTKMDKFQCINEWNMQHAI